MTPLGIHLEKKTDILPWCNSIYHTQCQNFSTSDLFGIIYTSTRTLKLKCSLFKNGQSVIDYQLVTDRNIVSGQINVF